MAWINVLDVIMFTVVPVGVGLLGSLITRDEISAWYQYLNKPPIAPPPWVFGPVWTTLYIMMGVASYLIFTSSSSSVSKSDIAHALLWYGIQLVLNGLWTPLFFGFHRLDTATFEIVLLLACIVITTIQFHAISPVAAYLLVPYIAWVSFATLVCASFWHYNPSFEPPRIASAASNSYSSTSASALPVGIATSSASSLLRE